MDVEVLRELVEVFKELGGEAKEAFIWYLIATELPGFILALLGIGAATLVVSRLVGVLKAFLAGERLRESYGSQYTSWLDREVKDACKILSEAREDS